MINEGVDGSEQGLGKLTKGEAANIITRLKHGAKVRERSAVCPLIDTRFNTRNDMTRRQKIRRKLLIN
jgi:hypothetical protein